MSALKRAEETLDALGNPVRREIINILLLGPRSVGSIAAELPVSRPAVSRHLRILEKAALVHHNAKGNSNLFTLNPTGFEAAQEWLNAFWEEGLKRFAALAEESNRTENE
ncbi:MAG: winged helix-turn-helix transcriptional regulator [Ignavibacteriae bacterium]|nr:winged helix-turn-helix transcriptional regulator [Ignavibacteriota bacterium]